MPAYSYDGHAGREAVEFVAQRLHAVFLASPFFPASLSQALKDAFRVTEQRLLQVAARRGWVSGTTAVVVVMQGDRLVVAHAGDSRAGANQAPLAAAPPGPPRAVVQPPPLSLCVP